MAHEASKVPGWLPLAIAAAGPVLATLIGGYQSAQVEQIRVQAAETQSAAERQQHDAEVEFRRQTFDAEQQTKREANFVRYIPKLLADDERDRDEAVAVLLILYPNTAQDIFAIVSDRIQQRRPAAAPPATPTLVAPVVPTGTPAAGVTPSAASSPTPTSTVRPVPAPVAQAPALAEAVKQAEAVKAATGTWLIVVGSDSSLQATQAEVTKAKPYGGVRVYKRGPWFATTIGEIVTKEQAQSLLISVRTKVRESAFVVNLNDWCGEATERDGYYECSRG